MLAKNEPMFLVTLILVTFAISFVSGLLVADVKASPASAYYYRFDVDREGFTDVTINFNSTDSSGDSRLELLCDCRTNIQKREC